jgi:hypothetical protein
MAIEIVDLPSYKMVVIYHSYVNIYQMVIEYSPLLTITY